MTRILPILAALILVIAGGAWYLGRSSSEIIVSAALAQDTTGAEILPDRILGNADATVQVIEYASYTCPHCASFHGDQFKQLKAEFIDTGKVSFIHREVYFDRYGLWGGLLANCGGDMRYNGISGMLYDQQSEWIGSGEGAEIIENLRTIGKTAGLTGEEVEACLGDQDMATQLVATYQHHAEADDVKATPTLVINGEKHSNMSYKDLKTLIEGLLAAE